MEAQHKLVQCFEWNKRYNDMLSLQTNLVLCFNGWSLKFDSVSSDNLRWLVIWCEVGGGCDYFYGLLVFSSYIEKNYGCSSVSWTINWSTCFITTASDNIYINIPFVVSNFFKFDIHSTLSLTPPLRKPCWGMCFQVCVRCSVYNSVCFYFQLHSLLSGTSLWLPAFSLIYFLKVAISFCYSWSWP